MDKYVVNSSSELPEGKTIMTPKCESCGHMPCDCEMTAEMAKEMSADKLKI